MSWLKSPGPTRGRGRTKIAEPAKSLPSRYPLEASAQQSRYKKDK